MKKVIAVLALALSAGAFANDDHQPVEGGDTITNGGSNVQGSLNSNVGNYNNDSSNYHDSSTYNSSSTINGGQTTNNYEGALVTQNTSNVRTQNGAMAGTAMAPSMGTSGYDSCSQGISAGASGPGFGLAFGKHLEDETCEIIKLTKLLHSMGLKDAAVALAIQDDRMAKAIRAANPALAIKFDTSRDGDDFREVYAEKVRKAERKKEIETRRAWLEGYEEDHQNILAAFAYPEKTHVVERGDTLWGIARDNGTTVERILQNNPSINVKDLTVGATIIL